MRHLRHVSRRELGVAPDAASAAADELSDLLSAVGRGDEAAFARLYDLTADEVYGLVRRIVRDPAHSQEVTQEAMVQVWRTAPRFSPAQGSARSWILTIAHRRAVDRVRREQTWRDHSARAAVQERDDSDPADEATAAVVSSVERARVRAALASLTDVQRQAIELAYFGGCTQAEIADLLGVPLGTVKTRTRDGLIRLRDQLGATP